MLRFPPCLAPKFRGQFVPFFRRIQENAKAERFRQTPFLEVSKEPSIRPPIPDPRKRKLVKIDLAREMNIKAGDRVQVLYGSEKGKQGIVGKILSKKNQVIVTGTNLKRSFWHPEPGPGKPSIVSVECPIHITNVALLDPVTKVPTRVKRRYMMNGECVRISKVSGCAMPPPVPTGVNERGVLFRKHLDSLQKAKERRGPLKEDIFGSRSHFETLVRIMRSQKSSEASAGAVR